MLTFFRTNQPLANILLLIYLGIVRFSTFIHPPTVAPQPQGILTEWMYYELPPLSLGARIAAFILVFIQAVFINIMMSRYRVMHEASLFPGLFYCLITAFIPEFLTLSSILLANTFIILAIFYLFDVYKNSQAAARIFDVGFWIGVASLFHYSYILFFIWGFMGLGILRGLRLKEMFMFLSGIIVPIFLFCAYAFWINKLPNFFKSFAQNFSFLNISFSNHPTTYVKLGVITLLVIIAFLGNSQNSGRRSVNTQKFIVNILWLLAIACSSFVFQSKVTLNYLLILAVPLSVAIALMFQRIGIAMAEVLHMLLLVIAMILQFEYVLVS